jgi:hypothetical protein
MQESTVRGCPGSTAIGDSIPACGLRRHTKIMIVAAQITRFGVRSGSDENQNATQSGRTPPYGPAT